MLTPRVILRLIASEELVGDPHPDACVELVFGPVPDAAACPEPLRITPADLLRLHVETGLVLGEIRAEAQRAENAWEQHLGHWYGDGRLAVEARAPDISLLQRVLAGLRNLDPVSA
ncbi:hypothetical protein GCM10022206_89280 [Streptomyces chiangmaiensis]